MIKNKYDYYTDKQLESYIKKLHKKLFWLLLYKDPETKDNYHIDFETYFRGIQLEINGLNSLFDYSPVITEIMSILEAALILSRSEEYSYREYRKLILDAHSVLDTLVKKEN